MKKPKTAEKKRIKTAPIHIDVDVLKDLKVYCAKSPAKTTMQAEAAKAIEKYIKDNPGWNRK